jgi:hypothetical protein
MGSKDENEYRKKFIKNSVCCSYILSQLLSSGHVMPNAVHWSSTTCATNNILEYLSNRRMLKDDGADCKRKGTSLVVGLVPSYNNFSS